jgi:hypothetical protein
MPPTFPIEIISYEIFDEILYATFITGVTIDLPGAHTVLNNRLHFSKGRDYALLIDVRGLKSITKEARDFLSSENGQKGIKASALLISGYLSSTIANFFLQVNTRKKKFPVKTFVDRQKAINWLQQYK